ncbi:MAG TPA: PaaI family thioesterase [Pseudomonas sp.]|uniref:PaaI family thioesterase n=1 Tax=Pseudomonas sp. Marseille-Q0931 TaxID=2697507 RepID=UPI000EC88422|nr:PaaI family thioesterase [Pseudomonas sp. Marseille-Q0931]HBZ94221.1 PaaI family thioesterase [Pseudomonas sp.]
MTALSREARLASWVAEEQTIRSQLAAPGTLSLAEVAAMTPMDFFDAIGRGDLPSPPINAVLDFTPMHWASGLFVLQGTPGQRHYNPLGSVHGGYIATLLKPGQGYTTTDLRVSYIRALRSEAGPVRAEGRIIHLGRSTALAEGRLYDVDERLYAVASTTCLILDLNAPRQNSDAGVR